MNDTIDTLDPELLKQIEESEHDAIHTEALTFLEGIILFVITFILFPLLGYLSY